STNHAPFADLLTDFFNRLVLEGAHGPVALEAGNLTHEVAQDRRSVRRVHHLKMELRRVEFALDVADDRDRRIRRRTEDAEALRRPGHTVAVAHPHRIFLTLAPDAFEQRRV